MRSETAGLVRALLRLDGRLTRRGFWMTFLALATVFLTVEFVALAMLSASRPFANASQGLVLLRPLETGLQLLMVWPALATVVRRGHDRGRPAVASLLLCAALVVPGLLAAVLPVGPRLLAQVVVLGWIVGDYGLLPGEVGSTRYGPDPLDRVATPRP